MSFSQIDICNLALSRLAAQRITSFNDNTSPSNECAAVYDMINSQVQAKGPWMCNKFRADLVKLTQTPDFGFANAFQLPTLPESLRILEINEDSPGDINYQVENDLLLTDESQVSILYLGLQTDPTKFGPYLSEAIVDALVAQMAYKFTGQQAVAKDAKAFAEENLLHLLTLDSLQGANTTLPSDTFLNVRLSSGSDIGDRPFSGE